MNTSIYRIALNQFLSGTLCWSFRLHLYDLENFSQCGKVDFSDDYNSAGILLICAIQVRRSRTLASYIRQQPFTDLLDLETLPRGRARSAQERDKKREKESLPPLVSGWLRGKLVASSDSFEDPLTHKRWSLLKNRETCSQLKALDTRKRHE